MLDLLFYNIVFQFPVKEHMSELHQMKRKDERFSKVSNEFKFPIRNSAVRQNISYK